MKFRCTCEHGQCTGNALQQCVQHALSVALDKLLLGVLDGHEEVRDEEDWQLSALELEDTFYDILKHWADNKGAMKSSSSSSSSSSSVSDAMLRLCLPVALYGTEETHVTRSAESLYSQLSTRAQESLKHSRGQIEAAQGEAGEEEQDKEEDQETTRWRFLAGAARQVALSLEKAVRSTSFGEVMCGLGHGVCARTARAHSSNPVLGALTSALSTGEQETQLLDFDGVVNAAGQVFPQDNHDHMSTTSQDSFSLCLSPSAQHLLRPATMCSCHAHCLIIVSEHWIARHGSAGMASRFLSRQVSLWRCGIQYGSNSPWTCSNDFDYDSQHALTVPSPASAWQCSGCRRPNSGALQVCTCGVQRIAADNSDATLLDLGCLQAGQDVPRSAGRRQELIKLLYVTLQHKMESWRSQQHHFWSWFVLVEALADVQLAIVFLQRTPAQILLHSQGACRIVSLVTELGYNVMPGLRGLMLRASQEGGTDVMRAATQLLLRLAYVCGHGPVRFDQPINHKLHIVEEDDEALLLPCVLSSTLVAVPHEVLAIVMQYHGFHIGSLARALMEPAALFSYQETQMSSICKLDHQLMLYLAVDTGDARILQTLCREHPHCCMRHDNQYSGSTITVKGLVYACCSLGWRQVGASVCSLLQSTPGSALRTTFVIGEFIDQAMRAAHNKNADLSYVRDMCRSLATPWMVVRHGGCRKESYILYEIALCLQDAALAKLAVKCVLSDSSLLSAKDESLSTHILSRAARHFGDSLVVEALCETLALPSGHWQRLLLATGWVLAKLHLPSACALAEIRRGAAAEQSEATWRQTRDLDATQFNSNELEEAAVSAALSNRELCATTPLASNTSSSSATATATSTATAITTATTTTATATARAAKADGTNNAHTRQQCTQIMVLVWRAAEETLRDYYRRMNVLRTMDGSEDTTIKGSGRRVMSLLEDMLRGAVQLRLTGALATYSSLLQAARCSSHEAFLVAWGLLHMEGREYTLEQKRVYLCPPVQTTVQYMRQIPQVCAFARPAFPSTHGSLSDACPCTAKTINYVTLLDHFLHHCWSPGPEHVLSAPWALQATTPAVGGSQGTYGSWHPLAAPVERLPNHVSNARQQGSNNSTRQQGNDDSKRKTPDQESTGAVRSTKRSLKVSKGTSRLDTREAFNYVIDLTV